MGWAEQGLRWTAGQAQDPASIILSTSPVVELGALLEMGQNEGVGRVSVTYTVSKVAGGPDVTYIMFKATGGTDVTCFIFRAVGSTDINHTELCE